MSRKNPTQNYYYFFFLKEQTNIPTDKESRPVRCAHNMAPTAIYHFKTSLKDMKKMKQDMKGHHKSELEKLSIDVTELRKELEIQ